MATASSNPESPARPQRPAASLALLLAAFAGASQIGCLALRWAAGF